MQVFKDILESIKLGLFSGEVLDLSQLTQKLTDIEVVKLAYILQTCPSIKKINLSYNSITDKGAAAIAGVNTLEELDFSNILSGYDEAPNVITAEGAAALAKSNLKKLTLHNNPIGDAGIAALALSETLSELDVSDCSVTGTGVSAFFSSNTHVLSLNLSSNYVYSEFLEKVVMNHVIQTLDLSHCFIDTAGAECLSRNDSLVELQLAHNDIGAMGARALAYHPRLRVLNLYECNLDDSALSGFATNTTLTSLCLSSNRITALGLEVLCNNKSLKTLNLDGNDIEFDRNALKKLGNMSSLTYICAHENRVSSELNEEFFLSYLDASTSIENVDFDGYCPSTQKTMLLFYNRKKYRTRFASSLEEPVELSSEFVKKAKIKN